MDSRSELSLSTKGLDTGDAIAECMLCVVCNKFIRIRVDRRRICSLDRSPTSKEKPDKVQEEVFLPHERGLIM